jgi:hypothetical protein
VVRLAHPVVAEALQQREDPAELWLALLLDRTRPAGGNATCNTRRSSGTGSSSTTPLAAALSALSRAAWRVMRRERARPLNVGAPPQRSTARSNPQRAPR